jgi:hypothetical protein
MQITLDLPQVFHPASSRSEDAAILRSLLDTLIRANLVYLQRRPKTPPLYKAGVVYGRTEVWDSIPALYGRRYGDCKSLSAARIAELLIAGVDAQPVFRWVRRSDGAKDFHILVQTYSGFEDPSRKLGMGKNENAYFRRRA